MQNQSSLWTIVLAGGEGTRMCSFVEKCFGECVPKQYCNFCGSGSMLERTIDRIADIVPSRQIVTVIGRGHRAFMNSRVPGEVLEQPAARGTAAGVFWPLSKILVEDSEATVLILPSDHYFYPGKEFVGQVRAAGSVAEHYTDHLILLGAVPDTPETDYGWIEPVRDSPITHGQNRIFRVSSFCEKPSSCQALEYFEKGYLWNTMIAVSPVRALWSLGKRYLPELIDEFERHMYRARNVSDAASPNTDALLQLYAELPSRDFSRDFLSKVVERSLVMPLEGVYWSDWGRPERLFESLIRMKEEFPGWAETSESSTLQTVWHRWSLSQPMNSA